MKAAVPENKKRPRCIGPGLRRFPVGQEYKAPGKGDGMNTVKIGAVKLQLVRKVCDTRGATWPGRRHKQRMDQKPPETCSDSGPESLFQGAPDGEAAGYPKKRL